MELRVYLVAGSPMQFRGPDLAPSRRGYLARAAGLELHSVWRLTALCWPGLPHGSH